MSQSLASVLVHIIFSTKKRQRWIQKEVIQDLHSYMVAIARSYDTLVNDIMFSLMRDIFGIELLILSVFQTVNILYNINPGRCPGLLQLEPFRLF
jgi:hypothetical protein